MLRSLCIGLSMDDVLFECRARGTTRERYRVRASLNWARCRWANLIVTKTQLKFGDWSIPYEEIEDAVIATVPIQVGTGTHGRLIVSTGEQIYQFILPLQSAWDWKVKVHSYWEGPLPFAVRRMPVDFERGYLNWLGAMVVGAWIIIFWLKFRGH